MAGQPLRESFPLLVCFLTLTTEPASASEHLAFVPSLSSVSYVAKAKVFMMIPETIEGTSRKLKGGVDLDDRGNVSAQIVIDASSFASGIGTRDQHVAQILDASQFPHIRFLLRSLDEPFKGAIRGQVLADGTLQVRDRQVTLRIPVTYRLAGDRITLDGAVDTSFGAFGLEAPILGFVVKRAANELRLCAHLVADHVGSAHGGSEG